MLFRSKAAIEQARKEGATHIVVSDAETAMMSEGHDSVRLSEDTSGPYETKQEADKAALRLKGYVVGTKGNYHVTTIPQEPGMRLNYDKILPTIASELTGNKGEKVSLGEHKNAYQQSVNDHVNAPTQAEWEDMLRRGVIDQQTYNARVVGEYAENPGQPRQNLIFSNAEIGRAHV